MNPFDFVPVDFNRAIKRRPPAGHERLSGLTGEIACTITAETPILVKGKKVRDIFHFKKNGSNDYIIPAASLKGVFRSLVETVGHGCFAGKFGGKYEDKVRGVVDYSNMIPRDFNICPPPRSESEPPRLCIACRLFGWLTSDKVYTGNVFLSDAVCNPKQAVEHPPVYTVDLMGPKPHHKAFYLQGEHIAGRKYYFHFPGGIVTQSEKASFNARIKPLGAGSVFGFKVNFSNLEEDELPYLLYALVLEDNMRHKIGYAKPSGFGSTRIEITHLNISRSVERYLKKERTEKIRLSAEENKSALDNYIHEKIASLTADQSPTMIKLREIWNWDPNSSRQYHYPSYQWFRNPENTGLPISETP